MNIFQKIKGYLNWTKQERQRKESTEEIYNKLSEDGKYDDIIQYKVRMERIKRALALIDIPYSNVLDLACGTGAAIDALPKKKSISVIGVDISAGMLAVAKKRFQKDKNIILQQKDFMQLSFPTNSFDLIILAHAIRFVPKDKEAIFFRKVGQWLKKNGVFLVIQTQHPNLFFQTIGDRYHHEEALIGKLNKFFHFEEVKTIGTQYFIFQTKAYYFKKK